MDAFGLLKKDVREKNLFKCKPREDELILSCVNLAFKCLLARYLILVQTLVTFHNFTSSPFWLRFPLLTTPEIP